MLLTILGCCFTGDRSLAGNGNGAGSLSSCRGNSGNGGRGSDISLVCSRRVRTPVFTPSSPLRDAATAPDAEGGLDGTENHVRCRGEPTLRIMAACRGKDGGLVDAGNDLPVGGSPHNCCADSGGRRIAVVGDGSRRTAAALRRDRGRNQNQRLGLGDGALDG